LQRLARSATVTNESPSSRHSVLIGVALWAACGGMILRETMTETLRDAALQLARYEVAVFSHL
jgi:hypothetical protein